MITIQEALQQYNAHFDNQKYQMIANHLAQDLRAERESLKVSDAMNLVSDAGLEIKRQLFIHRFRADYFII